MSEKTSIEWTATRHDDGTVTPGSTWNPIRGQNARHTCARISPGCDNCYAATMTRRGLMGTAPIDYGTGETPHDPARLDEKALLQPLSWRKPRKVFVCSMTDITGSWVPDEWLDRIFGVMGQARQHTFIVLTKRPTRMRDYLTKASPSDWYAGAARAGIQQVQPQAHWPLPNAWIGATIESDQYAWRADRLRQTPAAVRWISAEPLLGGLPSLDLTGIDWLVSGGESGPKARPSHPDWYRDLRDRCQAAGVAYFMKQWGAWVPMDGGPITAARLAKHPSRRYQVAFGAGEPYSTETYEMRHLEPRDSLLWRVGNHRSGRELDGRTWDQYPEPRASAGGEG